ncbi:MAG: hypothetical protein MZV64_71730 [Ignavibacteriales bacterium]|nr:hypothetical protein [Ignavibacteriales bacterium]
MGSKKALFLFLLLLLVSTAAFVLLNGRGASFSTGTRSTLPNRRARWSSSGDYLTVRIDYQPFWEKTTSFSSSCRRHRCSSSASVRDGCTTAEYSSGDPSLSFCFFSQEENFSAPAWD